MAAGDIEDCAPVDGTKLINICMPILLSFDKNKVIYFETKSLLKKYIVC